MQILTRYSIGQIVYVDGSQCTRCVVGGIQVIIGADGGANIRYSLVDEIGNRFDLPEPYVFPSAQEVQVFASQMAKLYFKSMEGEQVTDK